MYNALSADKTKNDFKEIKREIQSISEKLKSQITSPRGEEGYIYLVYIYERIIRRCCTELHGVFLLEGRQNDVITCISAGE